MKKFKEQLLKFTVFIFDILLSISISGCNTENYSARKDQEINLGQVKNTTRFLYVQ